MKKENLYLEKHWKMKIQIYLLMLMIKKVNHLTIALMRKVNLSKAQMNLVDQLLASIKVMENQ